MTSIKDLRLMFGLGLFLASMIRLSMYDQITRAFHAIDLLSVEVVIPHEPLQPVQQQEREQQQEQEQQSQPQPQPQLWGESSLREMRSIRTISQWNSSFNYHANKHIVPGSACLYGDMRFFLSENSTDIFASELLSFLGEVALRSFQDATSDKVIHVMIPMTRVRPHFEDWEHLREYLRPMLSSFSHLNVDLSPRAYEASAQAFHNTTCEWVVSVKLDADDVIAPGYVDWIVDKVLPTLELGAIVASRILPRLNYGFNRCHSSPASGIYGLPGTHQKCPYWAGWAVGQTRIFRRDVFEALGMPFQTDAHAIALSSMRSAIFTHILNETPPAILESDFQLAKDYALFRETEAEMELKTGIRMIESTDAGYGPAGIYMKTPLSSHFPFEAVATFDRCTPEVWAKAVSNATTLNVRKANYTYLHHWGQKSKLTFYHMCKSSQVFDKDRQFHGDYGTLPCEDMERQFSKTLIAATSPLNFNETLHNASNVCFFTETKIFFTKASTDVFVKERLSFFRDATLRSLNNALSNYTTRIKVLAPISTFGSLFRTRQMLREFLRPRLRKYKNLDVDYSPHAFNAASRTFKKTNCSWVVVMKLGADDVISPGYLDWITRAVIPSLDQGAVVASSRHPALIYGFDHCQSNDRGSIGRIVGHARIFRRKVFESIGLPFQSVLSSQMVNNLYSSVYRTILKKQPPAFLLDRDTSNITLRSNSILEGETGIRVVDPALAGFGPAGFVSLSPLSSSFPFRNITALPQCSMETWDKAISNVTYWNSNRPGVFDYLYDWGQQSEIKLRDVCISSYFFKRRNPTLFGTSNCTEMDENLNQILRPTHGHNVEIEAQ